MSFIPGISTGGGGLSSSSSSDAKAGNISIGGLTLAPPNNQKAQQIVIYSLVGLVMLAAILKRK